MKRFLRQFVFVLVPKLLSGLGSAGIGLVLMRYLEPAPFGALTLCLSTILLADGVLGSAFDLAAVRLASACADGAQARQVQRACLLLKLFALALGAGAVLTGHDFILKTFFKEQASPALLVYTGLAITAVLLLRSAQLSYQLAHQFRHYGLLDLMVSGLKCCGVAVLIALHRVDVRRVLLVFVLALGLVLAGWALTHGRALLAAQSTLPQLWTALRTASWFLLTFGTGAVVARVDLWLVARFVPESSVGIYAAAQTLALILPMLGTYLSVVVSPRVLPWAKAKRLLHTTYILQGGLLLTALGCTCSRWHWSHICNPCFRGASARPSPCFWCCCPDPWRR